MKNTPYDTGHLGICFSLEFVDGHPSGRVPLRDSPQGGHGH